MKKYCLFLPYHRDDVYSEYDHIRDEYPIELRRYVLFDNYSDCLNAYSNTMCPASQIITYDGTEEDLKRKLEIMNNNFNNPVWLQTNIYPYI